MDSCDVLIVGGGPAGSSCAWGLRHSGVDVVILDQQVFPRDKVCGGWITPGVFTALEIDPAEYSRDRLLQRITGFRVGSIGGLTVEISYGTPVSFGIRRREFDDYLIRRSGARLCLGVTLNNLERSLNGWIVNDRVQARLLVGAGGHFCPVARLTGAKAPHETPVVAQETEFEMDAEQVAGCRVRSDMPELYFCADMKGYGWCVRKGNYLNVGLGRADPHQLSAQVAEFIAFLKSAGRISFPLPSLHGHAYLLHGTSTRAVISDAVLLIGDAAGLACPQSGEGIWPAVESGLLAAKSIVAANGLYGQRQLESYRRTLAKRKPSRIMSLSHYMPSWVIGLLGRSLLRAPWFVREVVVNSWFLHPTSGPSRAG